jgi:hypothetical protein
MSNRTVRISRAIIFIVVLVSTAVHSSAQERYVRTSVDKNGSLQIVAAAGRVIVLAPEPEIEFMGKQVGIDHIRIAPDQLAVGWLALFPNCCTSYPIPLAMVVYSGGIERSYHGNGLPIWKWRFTAGGNRVAFRQETVHGGLGVHYELRDVRNGDLIAEYTPEVGPDNHPLPSQRVPVWVASLDAGQ